MENARRSRRSTFLDAFNIQPHLSSNPILLDGVIDQNWRVTNGAFENTHNAIAIPPDETFMERLRTMSNVSQWQINVFYLHSF